MRFKLLSLLFISLLIITSVFSDTKTKFYAFNEGQFGKSFLEITQGYPILHLYGTPKEKGMACGFLLRKQIKHLVNSYIHVIYANPEKYKTAIKKAKSLANYIPKEYLDEIKGISETSGVAYNDILLANTFLDIESFMGCSTFISHAANTKEKVLLFGRNLDFHSLDVAHKYDLIIVYHSEKDSNQDIVSITWPGFVGVISGINKQGLTATMLVNISDRKSSAKLIPCTFAFRKLLESKTNVKEAMNFFSKTKIASANNLTVADANNNSIVFELLPFRKTIIRHPENKTLFCTNYSSNNKLIKGELGIRYMTLKNTAQRYYKQNEKINLSLLKEILKKVAIEEINLQSMIFVPSQKKMYLSMSAIPAASGNYKEINLLPLFNKQRKIK